MLLVLHPGAPKCGSTSIQSFLYKNYRALEELGLFVIEGDMSCSFESATKERHWYPPTKYVRSLIHQQRDVTEFEERMRTLRQRGEEAGARGLILSSENLGLSARSLHECLAALFPERVVIYYVRRQDEYVVSCWQEWLHKQGQSLNEAVGSLTETTAPLSPNFLATATFLAQTYGKNRVHVSPLHRTAFPQGSLITDFLAKSTVTQLQVSGEPEGVANQALNPHLCAILAKLACIYSSRIDMHVKGTLEETVRAKDLLYRRDPNFLTAAARRQIMAQYAEENKQLHQNFFPQTDFETIYGLADAAPDEPHERLARELEGLRDVVSLQMDLLLQLLTARQNPVTAAPPPPSPQPPLAPSLLERCAASLLAPFRSRK